MQYPNDDMDDMFRNAAAQYPLKTDGADWDSLQKSIGNNDTVIAAPVKEKSRKLLWLLLLLFLSAGSVSIYFIYSQKDSNKYVAAANNNIVKKNQLLTEAGRSQNKIRGNNKSSGIVFNNSIITNTINTYPEKNKDFIHLKKGNSFKIAAKARMKSFTVNPDAIGPTDDNDKNNTPATVTDIYNDIAITETGKMSSDKLIQTQVAAGIIDSNTSKQNITKTFEKQQDKKRQNKTDYNTGLRPAMQKGFYAGILIGPDISTVKFQSIKAAGYSIGGIVGYRFVKRLSVETGLLLDKKYYYSKGEYFDKSKTPMPAYVDIVNLDGNCLMFELPLNIRYDIIALRHGSLFAVAGSSSYFMKKENYTYLASAGGSDYLTDRTYKNSGNAWFSVLNISAGYEHQVKKIGTLIIQPYIKIPFNGLGIGSLPVTSAGMYVGFTRTF